MCGVVGYFSLKRDNNWKRFIYQMSSSLVHRGPDSKNVWFDDCSHLALGHQRLSIVDLSPAGSQPMLSLSGRYVIAFNGEIYNHQDIRNKLNSEQGLCNWRGHSDTETLLAALERWGIQKTLHELTGMFAIVLWDRKLNVLSLIRDRMGEKPIYYGWQNKEGQQAFLFSSELKAMKQHPAFEGEVDRDALSSLIRYNYIPAPYSIYRGIKKLLPGHRLDVKLKGLNYDTDLVSKPYWSLIDCVKNGKSNPYTGSEASAEAALESLLKKAIGRQMIADVPVGAFLSGGVDSSLIVALMQAQSTRKIKTFTIGFDQKDYNEALYAKRIAQHLGTDHTELYVTASDAKAVIPKLASLYDEPFADSSQIPTYLVSKLARSEVTVSLSGDGGDEIFGGYNRYFQFNRLNNIPKALAPMISKMCLTLSPSQWNRVAKYLPVLSNYPNIGNKLHKVSSLLASDEFYKTCVSLCSDPNNVVLSAVEPPPLVAENDKILSMLNQVEKMMVLDTLTYLSDDILVKVDRAGMAVSLENRMPFLDHDVVSFAWQLPLRFKVGNNQGKRILRSLLSNYVPEALYERPKMGFGIPQDQWLRGGLKTWASDLLDISKLKREGFFNPEYVDSKWKEHLTGNTNHQYHLWGILMFQSWLAEQ